MSRILVTVAATGAAASLVLALHSYALVPLLGPGLAFAALLPVVVGTAFVLDRMGVYGRGRRRPRPRW